MVMGRKLLITLVGIGAALAGYLSIALIPAIGGFYATFVGALTFIIGLFMGGNVASQHVQAKQDTDMHVATVNAQASQPEPSTTKK